MLEDQAIGTTGAYVHLAGEQGQAERCGHPPSPKQIGFGPGVENDPRRRMECPRDDELAIRGPFDGRGFINFNRISQLHFALECVCHIAGNTTASDRKKRVHNRRLRRLNRMAQYSDIDNALPGGLAELYRGHYRALCSYIRAHFGSGPPAPEDVAQTAFGRLAEAQVSSITHPQAFLYTTARHIVLDHHRHERRVQSHAVQLQFQNSEQGETESSPENQLLQSETFRILADVLERMPLSRRRLVLLNRFEGLSYGEIGQRFGMSPESVRKQVERTLAQCLQALEAAERPRLRSKR